MNESEKLAHRAWIMLMQHGWPADAIGEVTDLLIGAGYHRCLEDQRRAMNEKEAFIERAARIN